MKLEVGKKYRLNNGEVHICTKKHEMDSRLERLEYGPFEIGGLLYHEDGRFANCGADFEISVAKEVSNG